MARRRPADGRRGDKRGFSLRGQIIYPVLSEEGHVLAWIGRDPVYGEKGRDFNCLSPTERTGETAPMKHRFPKGFHRDRELFGQHSSRLKEPGYRESIARHGIIRMTDSIFRVSYRSALFIGVFRLERRGGVSNWR